MASDNSVKFDDEYDIVVVGYGYAGGIAAIEAHDLGAKVLLVDKMANPGGISVCSYGAMRSAHNADEAFKYLKTTNGDRTPDDVVRALAEGMSRIEPYMRKLAEVNGAVVSPREKVANYPFDGYDTFYQTLIEEVPNFASSRRWKTMLPSAASISGWKRPLKNLSPAATAQRKCRASWCGVPMAFGP